MDPGLQLDLAKAKVVSSQFIDEDPEMTAFAGVQDILGAFYVLISGIKWNILEDKVATK